MERKPRRACSPSSTGRCKVVPAGAEWFHEVKYDGQRSAWKAMGTVCG